MHFGAVLLSARSVPRALKVTGLVVGVLLGLTSGLAAAAAVMATDVETSYDRVTTATDGFDALVYTEAPTDTFVDELRQVEGIDDAATSNSFNVAAFTTGDSPQALGPNPDDPCYTGAGEVAAIPDTNGWRGRTPQMTLAQGSFPRSDAIETVLPTITARRLGLTIGDRIRFTGDCGSEKHFDEPIDVTISGLGSGVLDGPAVGPNMHLETLLVSPRLADELVARGLDPGPYATVWLDDGVGPSELRSLPGGAQVVLDMVELRQAVRGDLRPDATALRAYALIVALSALVILGPLLARWMRAGSADAPTLRSLGMSDDGLVATSALRGAAVGLVAGITTIPATIGFATRLPLGAARDFGGAVSFSSSPIRVGAGALIVAASVLTATSTVGWVDVRRRRRVNADVRGVRVSRVSSTFGLSPVWGAGTRFALRPGSPDDPTPVRSGLLTAAFAVATVLGVITYSYNLDHLRNTPRLYGVNWDFFAITEDADALATALRADPEVEALARGTYFPTQPVPATLGDQGAEVWLMSFEAGPGRATPSIVSGRAPQASHEVMLARELSDKTGAGIGDVVDLHLLAREAMLAEVLGVRWEGRSDRITELEVVGIGVLPIGDGRTGIGGSMTFDGLESALGSATSQELLGVVASASPEALAAAVRETAPAMSAADVAAMSDTEVLRLLVEPHGAHMVVFDAGGSEQANRKAIAASGGSITEADLVDEPTPEAVLGLDLSQASRIPDNFSALMLVVAIAVIGILVATGGRQRRQELATLRALGFGARHVRRALAAQAVTTVLAAFVLAPVGIAFGRIAWLNYATGLGVVPEARVSPLFIAPLFVVLLVIALGVAFVAARFQAGRSLATQLRPSE